MGSGDPLDLPDEVVNTLRGSSTGAPGDQADRHLIEILRQRGAPMTSRVVDEDELEEDERLQLA